MIELYEALGESQFPRERGEIEFEFAGARPRPSIAWVALKCLGGLVLVAVGYALIVPPLLTWMSVTKAALLATGALMLYVGLAAVVRPRPRGENFGWLGGMIDDPTQYSDDINRHLFQLHMLLGPGRFLSETAVDVASLCGIVTDQPVEETPGDPMSNVS